MLQTHIPPNTHDEQEECREQLCKCGALPALIQLAAMDDEATKLRCVVAFANLSCEYTIRGQMVSWLENRSPTNHIVSWLGNYTTRAAYGELTWLQIARGT